MLLSLRVRMALLPAQVGTVKAQRKAREIIIKFQRLS